MMKKPVPLKHVLPISVALLVFAVVRNFEHIEDGLTGFFSSKTPPLIKLEGKAVNVSAWQYLGSWFLPVKQKDEKKNAWRDVVLLSFDKDKTILLDASVNKLDRAFPRPLTANSEASAFKKIGWKNNQISVFAFRAFSSQKQVALVEIDTDSTIALYVNENPPKSASGMENIGSGANLLIPVNLETGENIFVVKAVSNNGPPRLRMSLILDESKDFQAAWNNSWGFLRKLIYNYNKTEKSFEKPVVRWDSLLDRMTIGAAVSNALTGEILMQKEGLRNGDLIQAGGNALGEGVYKVFYSSSSPQKETVSEYFVVGDPKKVLAAIRDAIAKQSWSESERLNTSAVSKRAGILFQKANYDAGDKQWREKVAHTLGSLAECVHLKSKNTGNIFQDLKGLQFRGFTSNIDKSRQYYRLFIPAGYTAQEKLPLLLILPTTIANGKRSFLESPVAASQREALQIGQFAEKHGFGVLWPGYRNAPQGWACESAHVEEVLANVEGNYNIDISRISLYGTCSGAFVAGRLASIYPNRYTAIVYDRAIFERSGDFLDRKPDATKEWFDAINPGETILGNKNIKIFVLHNGASSRGHGEMRVTRRFLDAALPKRPDIKYFLKQRKIGVQPWDLIFALLADCKNEHPDNNKVDVMAGSGYAGPIADVFATPFIVVEGTSINNEDKHFMNLAIKGLREKYREQFYGARFVLKKDTEITDEEIAKYSLVLVGNEANNAVWSKLANEHPGALNPYNPPEAQGSSNSSKAFAEVFRNPCNLNNYVLLIGADRMSDMILFNGFDPFTACFDCYIPGVKGDLIYPHRPIR